MTEKQKFHNPYIYIFNSGGCHGHYLTYLIDRLSRKTPTIKELPFNKLGNSHNNIDYSGFAECIDITKQQEQQLSNKNIIKIIFSQNVLYYERVAMNRAGDAGRDINNIHNDISFFNEYNKKFYEKIYNLYSIENNAIPKWLLRDVYKLGFLDWNTQGSVAWSAQDIKWVDDNLAKDNDVHYTQVDVFFTTETLKRELNDLDNKFDLDLNLNDLNSIHKEFLSMNKILQSHKNTDIVLNAIKENKDITIPPLDIIQQAYIYAQLEKKYDFITMPLTNKFFETTKEILDYCTLYPKHYKAMNPNLPTFNNIPNPFFLHRQKNK